MKTTNQYQRIVPFILFIIALLLLFRLILPTIIILLSSILLAYISLPLYRRIIQRIPNKAISIVMSLLTVAIIILTPFAFLAVEITRQSYYFNSSLSNNIAKGALFGFGCTSEESKVCSLVNQAERFSLEQLSKFGIDKQLQKFSPILEETITNFILHIPIIIAQIILMLVISYFILTEWEAILNKVIDSLPMRKETVNRLIEEFGNITYTVVYGQLFVALIQGIVATIGFYIFGVPFPIFFGVVLAFSSLIPTIGTAMIWFPASLFLILSGYFSNNYWVFGKGIALFFYGILIISTIDNYLLSKIVHAKTQVNQIIVIIGIIGGASMFGVVGIFIGPILLPLLLTYFETFKERFV